jgi:hypothetical protein
VRWKSLLCMPAGMPHSTEVICATRGQIYTQNTDFTSPPFILTSGSHFRNDAIGSMKKPLRNPSVRACEGCARCHPRARETPTFHRPGPRGQRCRMGCQLHVTSDHPAHQVAMRALTTASTAHRRVRGESDQTSWPPPHQPRPTTTPTIHGEGGAGEGVRRWVK